MTKRFLITYDLNAPGKNYSELYEAIKNLGSWQHPLESAWVIQTSQVYDANAIYGRLRPQIDDTDLLFIVEITEMERQGWMPKSFWEWMKSK